MAKWSINGSNLPYSSVNALLELQLTNIAFNCGEGLERIMYKRKLPSIKQIFITRLDWRCLGGLPAVMLTLHRCGAEKASVFGPSTLKPLCDKILSKVPKEELDVTVVNCDNGHIHICKDNLFRIRAIPLRNPFEPYPRVFAYSGQIEGVRSDIDFGKCVDLDIPTGEMVQLSRGIEVTLDNGTVVRPADVSSYYYPKLKFLGKI